MTLKSNWQVGDELQPSDLNDIAVKANQTSAAVSDLSAVMADLGVRVNAAQVSIAEVAADLGEVGEVVDEMYEAGFLRRTTETKVGYGPSLWVGTEEPNAAAGGDVWLDTSGEPASITSDDLPSMTVGVELVPTLLFAAGTSPLTWEVIDGEIPGVSITTAGIVHGTPEEAGEFSITITVTNFFNTDEREFIVTVSEDD